VTATSGFYWANRDEEQASGPSLNDQRSGLTLAARYAPLRNVSLNCSVGWERRTGAGTRRDYDANLASCSIEALLR
jgi:hypothetical protein